MYQEKTGGERSRRKEEKEDRKNLKLSSYYYCFPVSVWSWMFFFCLSCITKRERAYMFECVCCEYFFIFFFFGFFFYVNSTFTFCVSLSGLAENIIIKKYKQKK